MMLINFKFTDNRRHNKVGNRPNRPVVRFYSGGGGGGGGMCIDESAQGLGGLLYSRLEVLSSSSGGGSSNLWWGVRSPLPPLASDPKQDQRLHRRSTENVQPVDDIALSFDPMI